VFLEKFLLPRARTEELTMMKQHDTAFTNAYPFKIFPEMQLEELEFGKITLLHGSNGSGKTTLLNLIAETFSVARNAIFNSSGLFGKYVQLCRERMDAQGLLCELPRASRIITSDDVFDFLFNLRCLSQGCDNCRQELFEEYRLLRKDEMLFKSAEDFDRLCEINDARRSTRAAFVKKRLMKAPVGGSNGESALAYFTSHIGNNALYLLDEPENSLSVSAQQDLADFLLSSARGCGCQFIISTHSPILLTLPGATVWDLDSRPARIRRWQELDSICAWFSFFESRREDFFSR